MKTPPGKVRITGGELRGRVVPVLDSPELKPTTDRAREGLFSMLASMLDFKGARVLDLFAGSGILGFEALSRGASKAVFVEKQRNLVAQIQKGAGLLHLDGRVSVVEGELPEVLKSPGFDSAINDVEPFSVIFADAPYSLDLEKYPCTLKDVGLLSSKMLLVVETHRKTPAFADLFLYLEKDRNYGDSAVRIYSFRPLP